MKTKWIFSVLIFLLVPIAAPATIIETRNIQDLFKYVNAGTWVFFDLDDTLLTPQYQLGRPEYFSWKYTSLRRQGMGRAKAYKISLMHFFEIQDQCPIKLIEPETFSVITQIQKLAAYTFALTARSAQSNEISKQQLNSVKIDFSLSAPKEISIQLLFPNLYDSGVWCVGYNDKGGSVRDWMDKTSQYPAKVVFIDDRLYNLENMEKALSDLNIEYIGLHYTKMLEFPFEPEIAEIQAKFFPEWISDEEARILLQKAVISDHDEARMYNEF